MEVPEVLAKCSSTGRRLSIDPNHSPEFEFWMVRNPSFPQPELPSADELFSDGILLPLHPPNSNSLSHKTEPESSGSRRPETGPEVSGGESTNSSKRWKDIFKKKTSQNCKEKDKKKKEKKGGVVIGGSNIGVNAAELNINIWPFSRSISAGNGGSRPPRVVTRKVNSAPCSRSNSAGRKWPSSPSRSGVHLGRSSAVWQVRRSQGYRKSKPEKVVEKVESEDHRKVTSAAVTGMPKARVLKLNVPMCIGYRQNSVCRSDENSAISVTAAAVGAGQSGGAVTDEVARVSNLFNIRSIFTKKVH
nr:uncharacterized protein LOC104095909 [Nicotiana tomentosiformis]